MSTDVNTWELASTADTPKAQAAWLQVPLPTRNAGRPPLPRSQFDWSRDQPV